MRINIILSIYLDKYWLCSLKYLRLRQPWFGKIPKSKKPSHFFLLDIGNTWTDSCLETAKTGQVIWLVEYKGVWAAGNSCHLLKEIDFYVWKRTEILTGKNEKCTDRCGTGESAAHQLVCYSITKCLDFLLKFWKATFVVVVKATALSLQVLL